MRERGAIGIIGLLCAVGIAGCIGGEPNAAGDDQGEDLPRDPVTWNIFVQDARFVKGSITIQVGDTVEWTNRDSGGHTVTADNGEFDSRGESEGVLDLAPDDPLPFAFLFAETGAYPYHCEYHSSMKARITVVERLDSAP